MSIMVFCPTFRVLHTCAGWVFKPEFSFCRKKNWFSDMFLLHNEITLHYTLSLTACSLFELNSPDTICHHWVLCWLCFKVTSLIDPINNALKILYNRWMLCSSPLTHSCTRAVWDISESPGWRNGLHKRKGQGPRAQGQEGNAGEGLWWVNRKCLFS